MNSSTENTTYIRADRMYSTRFTSNAAGQIGSFYDYSAYGQPAARSRGSDGLWYTADDMVSTNTGYVWGFTGRQWDGNGRYRYRARAYDPLQGRFLQRDPLEYVDGYNVYEYVCSALTTGLDPSGRGYTHTVCFSGLPYKTGMVGSGGRRCRTVCDFRCVCPPGFHFRCVHISRTGKLHSLQTEMWIAVLY